MPAGVVHGVRMLGVVSTESIYVEPAAAHGVSDRCQIISISPFLRSLIAQALGIPPEYDLDSHAGAPAPRWALPAIPAQAGRARDD